MALSRQHEGRQHEEEDLTRVETPARLRRFPYRIERMGISVNAEIVLLVVAIVVVFAALGLRSSGETRYYKSDVVHFRGDASTAPPTLAEYFDHDPWGLACAQMAYWRTDGLTMGFDLWWSIAKPNYMAEAERYFTAREVEKYLRNYARNHAGWSYQQVMADAESRSGVSGGVTLGPGESMEVTLSFPVEDNSARDAVGKPSRLH